LYRNLRDRQWAEESVRSDGGKVLFDMTRQLPNPPGIFVLDDGMGLVAKRLEHIPNSDTPAVRVISYNKLYPEYDRTAEEIRILFLDEVSRISESQYVAGETLAVRLLPETGSGTLAFALAPEDSVTFEGRGIRPLPPGQVQGNGSYDPDVDALITGDLALTWAHRDRLTQTSPVIVDHTGASIGPEPGVSYIVEVRWVDPDTGGPLLPSGVVIDAGTGTNWTLAPDEIPELGAPERTAEIEVAVRSRRLVEGSWITDREARWFRLTAPFAAGWDRGWGFLWGT
jgi:hypothetical protein